MSREVDERVSEFSADGHGERLLGKEKVQGRKSRPEWRGPGCLGDKELCSGGGWDCVWLAHQCAPLGTHSSC